MSSVANVLSKLVSQMSEGQISDLQRAPNAIIVGQALPEKLAVKTGDTVNLIGGQPAPRMTLLSTATRAACPPVDAR